MKVYEPKSALILSLITSIIPGVDILLQAIVLDYLGESNLIGKVHPNFKKLIYN